MDTIVKVTTICIKLEGKWVVDTYCRIGKSLDDKNFIDNFMSEYSGNEIEEIAIIETTTKSFMTNTISDNISMYKNLADIIDELDGNTTILDY